MTIVLVHGNPETEAIWDDLVPHLRGHDVVRLSPPGFGAAIPSGFDCSTDAYRDWLAGELIRHDWHLKPIHKLIMSSAAYQRSSSPNAAAAAIDSEAH